MAVIALMLMLGACGTAVDQVATTATPSPTTTVTETSTGHAVDRIVAGATDGWLQLPFTFAAEGEGTDEVGTVSIDGGTGTVTIGGQPLAAVVYQRQEWPAFGYVVFQTLAVAPDRWYALWLYCEGPDLRSIYFEGTDGTTMTFEDATGTCSDELMPSRPNVFLPAVDMPLPDLVAGYSIAGADVSLEGATPGSVVLGGIPFDLFVFADVDCTTACGEPPGWRELHAILRDRAGGRAGFAIFYLFQPGDPVLVTYSLMLPDLSDPSGTTSLEAMFSVAD